MVNPESSFEQSWLYSSTRWCIPSFTVIHLLVPEKDFLSFYHIWAWWPSWSCDQDHLSKLLFPHPIEAPYEIWLWLTQWYLRRRCLNSVDDDDRRRHTTEAYLSYLLNKWAFGSGELINVLTAFTSRTWLSHIQCKWGLNPWRYNSERLELSCVTRKPVFGILWPGEAQTGLLSYRD